MAGTDERGGGRTRAAAAVSLVASMVVGILAAGPAMVAGSARADGVERGAWKGDPMTDDDSSAGLAFAFDLHREVAREHPGKNVFLSPWSVSSALVLAANGARGETLEALLTTLRNHGLTLDDLNRAAEGLRSELTAADSTVLLEAANSLWLRTGLDVLPGFLAANRAWHRAEVATLDFSDPGAPRLMNAWVARATHDRIPTIVDRLDPRTVAVLMNAIYFKGRWSRPFDPGDTHDAAFAAPGGSVPVRMMERRGKTPYAEDEHAQIVALPYGDGRIEMVLVLPRRGVALDEVVDDLDPARWEGWMSRLAGREGRTAFPRFRLEQDFDLVRALGALGMGIAFEPAAADFSGIARTGDRLFLSGVRHKTFVEVNEEGTEAAAATSIMVGITSAPSVPPFDFVADRPFLCAIRDSRTGAILFLGSVAEPPGE